MPAFRHVRCLVALGAALCVRMAAAQPAPPQFSPAVVAAIAVYWRDPGTGARPLLDAARFEPRPWSPGLLLVLGDASVRIGRYRDAEALFAEARDGTPGINGLADLGLAWASMARGRLADARDYYAAAAAEYAGWAPAAEFGIALLDAADGVPEARTALAAAAASPDPDLREVAPFADAYARYWAGDYAGAAEAFMAFAVANADSRFADDALYAAARATDLAGRPADARVDLEALAAGSRQRGHVPAALLDLDARAVLRHGMRRDRGLPGRSVTRRVADLLDGDGVWLARAALERGPEGASEPAAAPVDVAAGATPAPATAMPDAPRPPAASRPDGRAVAPRPPARNGGAIVAVLLVLTLLGVLLFWSARRGARR